MEKVDNYFQRENFTRDYRKMPCGMGKELLPGLMEGAIKVNSLMISFMEKESIYMRIKALIKDNGFQTNMKVKEQGFM